MPEHAFSEGFSPRQLIKHINVKEMRAVLYAMRRCLSDFAGAHLVIYEDNYITTQGLVKSSVKGGAMAPLRQIAMLAARYNISSEIRWIPSDENRLADLLSRARLDVIAIEFPQLMPLYRAI